MGSTGALISDFPMMRSCPFWNLSLFPRVAVRKCLGHQREHIGKQAEALKNRRQKPTANRIVPAR